MVKTCTKCKIEKDISEYNKNRSRPDGHATACKVCKRAWNRAYYRTNAEKLRAQKKAWSKANREKIRAKNKAYYRTNAEKLRARKKAYYQANSEKILAHMRDYYQANSEKIRARSTAWRKANPEKARAQQKAWRKANQRSYVRKMMQNPVNRLHHNIKRQIQRALIYDRHTFGKWREVLGYTWEELKEHLEAQFEDGMTWENYGTGWHVDHITPISWFNVEGVDCPDFKKCWALENLQPMWARQNISKGNRYAGKYKGRHKNRVKQNLED